MDQQNLEWIGISGQDVSIQANGFDRPKEYYLYKNRETLMGCQTESISGIAPQRTAIDLEASRFDEKIRHLCVFPNTERYGRISNQGDYPCIRGSFSPNPHRMKQSRCSNRLSPTRFLPPSWSSTAPRSDRFWTASGIQRPHLTHSDLFCSSCLTACLRKSASGRRWPLKAGPERKSFDCRGGLSGRT